MQLPWNLVLLALVQVSVFAKHVWENQEEAQLDMHAKVNMKLDAAQASPDDCIDSMCASPQPKVGDRTLLQYKSDSFLTKTFPWHKAVARRRRSRRRRSRRRRTLFDEVADIYYAGKWP
mmetsp:Transcript_27003/g.75323  ORF Transcript_27003/g.75323 Transcript_27003/m.75323 type:complete len:119 (+) Transcript_27003:124-480(+)